ncbi:MAG: hypothetical protein ABH814_01450 [bacterium]
MALNLTTSAKKISDEVDIPASAAPPLFWAVAAFVTEGDVVLRQARSETEPLGFLTKFQQLGVPFEVQGNDLHVWYEAPLSQSELSLENSFSLCLVPLFLKFPFPITISNISDSLLPSLEAFVREARRVGADVKITDLNVLKVAPSKIKAGRFAFNRDNEVSQALLLLSFLSRGKSTFLGVPSKNPDWVEFFNVQK